MHQTAVHDLCGRTRGEVKIQALYEMVAIPKGEDLTELWAFEFTDADKVDVDGLGQVPDE
jgi:hypothetical protein